MSQGFKTKAGVCQQIFFGSMGRGKLLSSHQRSQIDAYKACGKSNREIASLIGKSANAVNQHVKRGSCTAPGKSSGRKPSLSLRDRRQIIRDVQQSGDSIPNVRARTGVAASRWTVWRAVRQCPNVEYVSGQSAWKPHHVTARLDWATRHASWTSEWQRVVFSDEKKWNLDGPDNLHSYWHDLRQEPRIFKRRQMGGGSVMTWAAFGHSGQTRLQVVDGRMNSKQYTEMLEKCLLPAGRRIGGSRWIFQQDGASIHTSKLTMDFLQRKRVRVLDWPALSPDLNPIENLWGILARQVYSNGKQYSSTAELSEAVRVAWAGIGLDTRRKLVASMHARCLEVLKSQGGKTRF
jgi:transposase